MEERHIQNIQETDDAYVISFGKAEEDVQEFLEETEERALTDIDTKPTSGMVSEAKKGLAWRREHGRGGTAVGIARARTIANGQNLSISTVKRMYSFFSRHEVDKKADGFSPGEKGYPSNGRIAWALWGGDAGFSWSSKKVKQIENEQAKKTEDLEKKDTVINYKRVFELDTRNKPYDEEKRTVNLAFSSEEPYKRNFGMEVLSHKMDEVEMEFLNSGRAPLLLDHDSTKQIGVIEKAYIDENDKVGRATVRFGQSNLSKEIFQDVVDGIRKNISVGYEITNMAKMERNDDDKDDYYRVSWRPLEVSSVSIPADTSVGVGRARDINNKQPEMAERQTMENSIETPKVESPNVDVAQLTEKTRKDEVARIKEISALGAKHNCKEIAEKGIADGLSIAEFRGKVLNHIGDAKPLETKSDEIGLTKRDARDYSLARAVQALVTGDWSNAQLEREASEEIAKRNGKSPRGFFVPSDVSWQRDLTQGTATAGGNLVATDLLAGSYVDALRSRSFVRDAGATVLSGLQGDVAIPAANAVTTAYWVAENAAPTEGAPTYRQITMNPKTVAAYVDISRHLMMQSTPAIETIVRNDIVKGLASAVDKAALQGSGSSNQPTGVLNTSGIGSVAIATNGGPITYGDVVDTWKEVATDNADVGSLAWFTTPVQVSRNMQKPKVASTDSVMIQNEQGNLMGYKLYSTTNMPDNLTKGSSSGNCSALLFGNFNDLVIAEWGNLDVMVDPYSLSTQGATRIAAFYDIDIGVRHAESFAAIKDLLAA